MHDWRPARFIPGDGGKIAAEGELVLAQTVCPKCHYERKPSDTAPDWQCPACGIAYVKYHPPVAAVPASPAAHVIPSAPPATEREMTEAEAADNRRGARIVGMAFIVPGLIVMVQGFRYVEVVPGEQTGRFILAFGALVVTIGCLILGKVFDWGESALRALSNVALFCFGFILNYVVFLADPSGWSGDRIAGSFSMGHAARLIATSLSLYSLIALAEHAWKREESKRHFVPGFLYSAFALSIVLHATGILDRIDNALGQPRVGPLLTRGALRVERRRDSMPQMPLESFAGTWGEIQPMMKLPGFNEEWVRRAIVRVDSDKVTVNLWRGCGQALCDMGTFTADVQARGPERVLQLDMGGQIAGMDWIVMLTPNGVGQLNVNERHIRGTNWGTHQQRGNTLKRER